MAIIWHSYVPLNVLNGLAPQDKEENDYEYAAQNSTLRHSGRHKGGRNMITRNHTWKLGWRSLSAIALLLLVSIITAGAAFAGMKANVPATAGKVNAAQATYKIAPDLLDKFKTAGANGQVHYWVQLADQADTSNSIPTSNWSEKGWFVYNALTKKATETQKPLLDELSALQSQGPG